ncbi:MAG TPA: hypothetical protein VFB72_20060 [Verrucomicrobiae bacterium]|nr:hypothetical protein [Verrucomicrobiae bacterium]
MNTIPLPMPPELIEEVRRTAQQAQVSSAEIMRKSIRAGLPKVREALIQIPRLTNVDALPRKAANKLYAEREDDLASIRQFIKAQPKDAD